jgi:3'(2'), 5'-bisphosphate nucleotidase
VTRMGNLTAVDDHEVARSVATVAGGLLVTLRDESPLTAQAELGDEGDRYAHDAILGELAALRPGDAVLSEEAASDDARLSASRVWIVDPLDGTREFREGRSDWAVHIALVVDGVPVAGAVALPALDVVLTTCPAPRLPERNGAPVRMVVSRTRPPEVAGAIRDALGAETIAMGSAGAKAGAVIRGEADVYIHAGGQYEWDSAAPVAVAVAAGLHASRLDGGPLRYNQADPWLPDLLICRPELAPAVLAVTRSRG